MRKLAIPNSPRSIGRGATNLPDSQHRIHETTGTATVPTVGSGAARWLRRNETAPARIRDKTPINSIRSVASLLYTSAHDRKRTAPPKAARHEKTIASTAERIRPFRHRSIPVVPTATERHASTSSLPCEVMGVSQRQSNARTTIVAMSATRIVKSQMAKLTPMPWYPEK